jgi:hypothetical protein
LKDIKAKSKKLFFRAFPEAKYNGTESTWTFKTGETLKFGHFATPDDYYSYHGHEYQFIGWEELTTWPSPDCFKSMFSCLRTTVQSLPLKVRATTNPYGSGHNWVKRRYRLPAPPGLIVGEIITDSKDESGLDEEPRVAIHGMLWENRVLLDADPDYPRRIRSGARNKSELKAWMDGSWDITAGGMFDDLWQPECHVLSDFLDFKLSQLPNNWIIDRSYDHGQSKPFSVGWWAESNGEPMTLNGNEYGHVRGDIFRIAEWYGCTEEPNTGLRMGAVDIADGIIQRENSWGIYGRVRPGPADSSIFNADASKHSASVATDFASRGVVWMPCDKSAGSRKLGWQQLRKRLHASIEKNGEAGLYFFPSCRHSRELLPALPRSHRDPDDVDTDAEDHIGDEIRYRLRFERPVFRRGSF